MQRQELLIREGLIEGQWILDRLNGYMCIISFFFPGLMHLQGAIRNLGLKWTLWGLAFVAFGLWCLASGFLWFLGALVASWAHVLLMIFSYRKTLSPEPPGGSVTFHLTVP